MASATSALATLAPYQPPDGLAPRELFAHAREHIERLTKKHAALQEKSTEKSSYVITKGVAALTSACAVGTSGALGFVNGRLGGDLGYAQFHGMPADWTAGVVAHVVGYTNALGKVGSVLVHAAGDAAWGAGTYRWAHAKGVELAQAAAAKAGATPGASPQNGAGAGPRGGTSYAVPQK